MSKESYILLSNVLTESSGFGEKHKGAGYNRRDNGLHTVVFSVEAFKGSVGVQGTLEIYPGEADWVDLVSYNFDDGSTLSDITTTHSENFTGNFVWIRASYVITNGKIVEIRYNY